MLVDRAIDFIIEDRSGRMFPNDDICNVQAALSAAQRLFRRYKSRTSNEDSVLGKKEVNRLMKATYEAINMPYDPNEEDVFSFIGIFDSNQDGQIELKDLEQMAVKYLCGEDALGKLTNPEDKMQQKMMKQQQVEKTEKGRTYSKVGERGELNKEKIQQKQIQTKIVKQSEVKVKKELTIDCASPAVAYQKIYTPIKSNPISLNSYFSPKSRISFKDSMASTDSESTMAMKTEVISQKIKYNQQQINAKGKDLFEKHLNTKLQGISNIQAGKLMTSSYELFGKKNFVPSQQDIKIWMKLCDRNKDGVVDWQDYKYFLQRTYERQQREVKF